MNRKLLVIDDHDASCRLISAIFSPAGYDVLVEHDGPSGLRRAAAASPDVVLLDVRMPAMDGLAVLELLRDAHPSVPVLMLTASADIRDAVRATQLGAFDYLTKPIGREDILVAVRRAVETRALRQEVQELRRDPGSTGRESLRTQMGTSAEVARIADQVDTVARSPFTVLVLGDTGTGKELVAQAIHRASDRARKPFVALDCGAIPEPLLESELFGHERGAFTGAERRREGRFRLAEGGTCFLDEVGNLPMNLQAKLLRVLESGQVYPVGAERATPMDVRFVAATNHDLQERVSQGLFRADLYFRLAQYAIRVPPLRDRIDDIPYLTQRFVEEASIELRRPIQAVAPEALHVLQRHTWPGNVRELRNVVRQAVLLTAGLTIRADTIGRVLGGSDQPLQLPDVSKGQRSLRDIGTQAAAMAERQAICEALRATSGNKSRAAKVLQTDYKTLHVKMKQWGIRARDFTP